MSSFPVPTIVAARDIRIFVSWTTTLDYNRIRRHETLHQTQFEDGRRVRGVALDGGICLARDGQFYDLTTSIAVLLTPTDMLRRAPLVTWQRVVAEALR